MTTTLAPITHGHLCWTELCTRDVQAATHFYTQLLGWTTEAVELDQHTYTFFKHEGMNIAGMLYMDPDNWPDEVSPHWMNYIKVDDVDAVCTRVTEAGGSLCHGPADISVGRFAVITDPTGGTISLLQSAETCETPQGDCMFDWAELASNDPDAAAAFYAAAIGWTTSTPDADDDNPYLFFQMGEEGIAGLFKGPVEWGEDHPSCWTPCLRCEDLDATVDRGRALGATIYVPPTDAGSCVRFSSMQTPTGEVIVLYKSLTPSA